jgi:hypothetical protein
VSAAAAVAAAGESRRGGSSAAARSGGAGSSGSSSRAARAISETGHTCRGRVRQKSHKTTELVEVSYCCCCWCPAQGWEVLRCWLQCGVLLRLIWL